MCRNLKLLIWGLAASIAALLSITCSSISEPGNTGTATETENVAAMIRNPGGTPAAYVKVWFYPVDYNPRTGGIGKILATIDSAITDTNGNYTVTLDTGTYNVLAVGDSGLLYQDSIAVGSDSAIHAPADTLKAPGSLSGVIRLQEGDDARKVFILLMGTNTFISPADAAGNFTLADKAQGRYTIRILSIIDDYGVLDTAFDIKAGVHDILGDTIVLPYSGVPIPNGLTAQWDSLRLSMQITWSKLDTSLVAGYNLYRCYPGQIPTGQPLNASLIATNEYTDTTCAIDTAYVYYAMAEDRNGKPSPAYSNGDTARTGQAYHLAKTISISPYSLDDLTPLAVSNGNIFIINSKDISVKVLDSLGTLIRSFGTTQPGRLNKPWNIRVYNDLVYIGDRSDTLEAMMDPYATGIIKIFTLQGAFVDSINLACPIQINMGPYSGGDYYISPGEDVFFTTGELIWRITSAGARDSIIYPLDKGIIFYPKLEFAQGKLITASGLHYSSGSADRCQIAVVDTSPLALVSLENNTWWYRSMAVDTAGKMYIATGQSLVNIYSPDKTLYARFFVPSALYWDIAVDFSEDVYLYDWTNRAIHRFVKNQ